MKKSELDPKRVSIIVCTKNVEKMLKRCLESVIANNPLEIIVIDGKSKDRTVEIARDFTSKIYEDPGLGLSTARNLGITKAKGEYVLFVGPDNIVPKNFIKDLLRWQIKTDWVVTGTVSRVQTPKSYIERANDFRLRVRIYPGEKDINKEVVGTPYLIPSYLFKTFKYDSTVEYKDDVALMEDFSRHGYRFGRSDVVCFDMGSTRRKDVLSRFRMYGLSDFQYFKKNYLQWSFLRRLKSFIHPIKAELLIPITKIRTVVDLQYIPFLSFITFVRVYRFWGLLMKYWLERRIRFFRNKFWK